MVELESPASEAPDSGIERGGSHTGHRFGKRIEHTETASSGTFSSRTVGRDGEATVGI